MVNHNPGAVGHINHRRAAVIQLRSVSHQNRHALTWAWPAVHWSQPNRRCHSAAMLVAMCRRPQSVIVSRPSPPAINPCATKFNQAVQQPCGIWSPPATTRPCLSRYPLPPCLYSHSNFSFCASVSFIPLSFMRQSASAPVRIGWRIKRAIAARVIAGFALYFAIRTTRLVDMADPMNP